MHDEAKATTAPPENAEGIPLLLLQEELPVLLELSVRFQHLPDLHAREPLGHDMQQHHLDLPRLRRDSILWEWLNATATPTRSPFEFDLHANALFGCPVSGHHIRHTRRRVVVSPLQHRAFPDSQGRNH